MARNESRDGPGNGADDPGDVDLSARLQRLEQRLAQTRDTGTARKAPGGTSGGDAAGMARAFRLSTEFVAGIVAGVLLGWAIDKVAGTKPWGLIVLTMLGFGAGIWNVMRASGFVRPPQGPGGGDASGPSV
jgi:ATP synthase protein I